MRTKDGAASPLLLADRALATLPLSPDCRRRETRAEFDRGLEGMRSQPSLCSFSLSDAKVKFHFVSLKTYSSIMIIITTLVESSFMKIVPQSDRPQFGVRSASIQYLFLILSVTEALNLTMGTTFCTLNISRYRLFPIFRRFLRR